MSMKVEGASEEGQAVQGTVREVDILAEPRHKTSCRRQSASSAFMCSPACVRFWVAEPKEFEELQEACKPSTNAAPDINGLPCSALSSSFGLSRRMRVVCFQSMGFGPLVHPRGCQRPKEFEELQEEANMQDVVICHLQAASISDCCEPRVIATGHRCCLEASTGRFRRSCCWGCRQDLDHARPCSQCPLLQLRVEPPHACGVLSEHGLRSFGPPSWMPEAEGVPRAAGGSKHAGCRHMSPAGLGLPCSTMLAVPSPPASG
ncbi:unnamed protein product [Symbiodinium natans]|uniref:Uncharacterized protein n=1 Tax=Symbiodinium natans TaxID=878477 RepID=A0A812LLK1_9DINO|nr:unnamed protein product [Symbiodinium natans]